MPDRSSREERKTQARLREEADLQWFAADPRGRRILCRIFEKTGVPLGDVYAPHAVDMAKRAGMHEVGQWLLAQILEVCPERFLQARAENKKNPDE